LCIFSEGVWEAWPGGLNCVEWVWVMGNGVRNIPQSILTPSYWIRRFETQGRQVFDMAE